MIEKEQTAHDLAVAKLCGSELQTKDLIKQYREYYEEILSVLNSEPKQIKPAKIGGSPI